MRLTKDRSTIRVLSGKDLEFRYIQTVQGCMRASGEKTRGMDKVMRSIRTELSIRGSSNKINLMAKEFTIGKMARFMMVNGFNLRNRGSESGREMRKTRMQASGRIIKQTGMVFMCGLTEISTKASG